ncbi:DUF58 domain-containing protein [Bacteroidales bacterium OttesenSCG-928-M06]|nr:DUF58 domain-containing protein [Bacteroidales bacterium OttesenSCG-928-M06]
MFLNRRFYIFVFIVILCFIAGYAGVFMFTIAQLLLLLVILLTLYEVIRLYVGRKSVIKARRECPERFSNGDTNEIKIHLSNEYPFPVSLEVIDELPSQFQIRDLSFILKMDRNENKVLNYEIRPVERGLYRFGLTHVFVTTRIGFISRRFKLGKPNSVKVYPSFVHLKEYELVASTNKLMQSGAKKIRKIGQQLEPDQIKDYIKGDDYRFINWKATARRGKFMTNVFQDERAQNVYCLIDKGRTMQSAFEKMTLLDYSINSALAVLYVSMLKGDKAGLVAFERKVDSVVPASRKSTQMQAIQEALYYQQTAFYESDFQCLYQTVNKDIKNRSLLIVYTNFDSVRAMQRQLRYLSILAKRHTVLVVFFENTELENLVKRTPVSKTEAYETIVAEKLEYEKKLIVYKLRQYNIMSLLSHPDNLTINVINRYLDIKAREI